MTLETLRGTVEAGASVRDVRLGAWPRVLRRMGELGMDEASLSRQDLRALVADGGARGELRRLLSRRGGTGIEGIDTGAMRLAFPCRVRVRLRSGGVREAKGAEPGAGGAPVAEQRAVVEAKCAAVGAETGSLTST
jgi:hypothetical protein